MAILLPSSTLLFMILCYFFSSQPLNWHVLWISPGNSPLPYSTYPLMSSFKVNDLKCHLLTDDLQIFISSLNLCPRFRLISNYLLSISTWMSNRHLKIMSKIHDIPFRPYTTCRFLILVNDNNTQLLWKNNLHIHIK